MEKDGLLYGQYDRVIRSLERRLAAGDTRSSQGMRDRIRTAVRNALTTPPNPDLSNHLALLELSHDQEGRIRLLTTNFDTLFEQSWRNVNGQPLSSHACQAMPRPKAASFSGVLHLHGRLRDEDLDLEETELILTSAEFGDAYLRSGWASRYVYDLARTHILVIVGYQAEDPPMRYLLEALEADRERYPDLKAIFAFAGIERGAEQVQAALWRAKGLHPILYELDHDGGHTRLYETLRRWRSYAEDPTTWRRGRLAELLAGMPATASTKDLDQIVSLLRHNDAERILAEIAPAPEWIPVLKAQGVFPDGGTSPGPWIACRLSEANMIRACAEAQLKDERTWAIIERTLERELGSLCVERQAWRLIARAAHAHIHSLRSRWYDIRRRIDARDFGYETREAIAHALRPQLKIRRPYEWPGLADSNDDSLRLRCLVDIDFEVPDHAPRVQEVLQEWPQDNQEVALLRSIWRTLEQALEEADDAGFLEGLDRASFDVPSIADHPQNQHRGGFMPIIRMAADLWQRLALRAAPEAKRFAAIWAASGFCLIRRLYLHTLTEPSAFTPTEVATTLRGLNDDDFWMRGLRREVMRLMVERWREFDLKEREAIEVRIRAGVPRSLFEPDAFGDEAEWVSMRDHSIFERLARIRSMGGPLADESLSTLATLQDNYPAWQAGPGDRDDFWSWTSSIEGPRGDLKTLDGVEDADLVRVAMRLQAENHFEQGNVWRLFCEADPERALRSLTVNAAVGDWNIEAWPALLCTAWNVTRVDLQQTLAAWVLRMPEEQVKQIAAAVLRWLRNCRSQFSQHGMNPSNIAISLWDKVADCVYSNTEEAPSPGLIDINDAINEPGGMLAELLCDMLSEAKPAPDTGFGPLLAQRFQRVLNADGRAGTLARVYLARVLPWIHHIAPAPIEEQLLPRFFAGDGEANALWGARLRGVVPCHASLFNALKPALLSLFSDAPTSRSEARGLAHNLLIPAISSFLPNGQTFDIKPIEVRSALASTVPEVRHHASWMLWRWMEDAEDEPTDRAQRWREVFAPFFQAIWPPDLDCRDKHTSQNLVQMICATREAFSEAVDLVVDVLVPYEIYDIRSWMLTEEHQMNIPSRYPWAFLKLLNAILKPASSHGPQVHPIPRDLMEVLSLCQKADPIVIYDPAYRRLKNIARSLSS